MDDRIQRWKDLAAQIGVDSIRCTTEAGSGHPTSSLSCAHLLAVLYANHLRLDVEDPKSLANDRFVMSKGHAAPALYATLKAIGAISDDELLSPAAVRLSDPGPPRAACPRCRGSTWPPARSVRGSRSAWAWRSRCASTAAAAACSC